MTIVEPSEERRAAQDAARASVRAHQRGIAPLIPYGRSDHLQDRLPHPSALTRFGLIGSVCLPDDIGWPRIEVPVYFNGRPMSVVDPWVVGGATAQRLPSCIDVLVIFAPGPVADDVFQQLSTAGPGLGAISLVIEHDEVVGVSLNVGEARLRVAVGLAD